MNNVEERRIYAYYWVCEKCLIKDMKYMRIILCFEDDKFVTYEDSLMMG